MTTNEQKAEVILLLMVATIVHGLRQEYRKLIQAKSGPLDHGYTATFVAPEDDYLLEQFYCYWTRQKIRAARLQALRVGG
jgi:hypothetical protein